MFAFVGCAARALISHRMASGPMANGGASHMITLAFDDTLRASSTMRTVLEAESSKASSHKYLLYLGCTRDMPLFFQVGRWQLHHYRHKRGLAPDGLS
jgi:hypothetical protein